MNFLNRVRVNVASLGTGALAPGTAYSTDSLTMTDAGAVSGLPYSYQLKEGNDVEMGWGIATFSGGAWSLTRNVLRSKIGGVVSTSAKINLSGNGVLIIDALAEDLAAMLSSDVQSLSTAAQTQMLKNLGAAPLIVLKTTNYNVTAADRGKLMSCSIALGSTLTLGTLAAATAGESFTFLVENTGYGAVVIDPNGSETIDGETTINVFKGQPAFWVISDGVNWRTVGRQKIFTIASVRSATAAPFINFTLPDALPSLDLILTGVYASTASVGLVMRSSSNGSTFEAGGTDYQYSTLYGSGTTPAGSTALTSFLALTDTINNSSYGVSGHVNLARGAGLAYFTALSSLGHYNPVSGQWEMFNIKGWRNGIAAKAIQLLMTGGNINAEQVSVTGYAP